jgi:hypothetical protein
MNIELPTATPSVGRPRRALARAEDHEYIYNFLQQLLQHYYALDNLCDSIGTMASWDGFVLHDGRVHSHFAGCRACRALDPHYSGTTSRVAFSS